jgi:hypothetical protein
VIAHSIHLCIPSQPIRNLEQHKIARKIRRSYQDPYRLQHRVCARDHLCKRSRKVRILGFYDMEDGKGHTDNIRKNAILVAMLPHLELLMTLLVLPMLLLLLLMLLMSMLLMWMKSMLMWMKSMLMWLMSMKPNPMLHMQLAIDWCS